MIRFVLASFVLAFSNVAFAGGEVETTDGGDISVDHTEAALLELEDRVSRFEYRLRHMAPGGTPFDPSGLQSQIDELRKRLEGLVIPDGFDPTEINNRLTAIERKLEELANRPPPVAQPNDGATLSFGLGGSAVLLPSFPVGKQPSGPIDLGALGKATGLVRLRFGNLAEDRGGLEAVVQADIGAASTGVNAYGSRGALHGTVTVAAKEDTVLVFGPTAGFLRLGYQAGGEHAFQLAQAGGEVGFEIPSVTAGAGNRWSVSWALMAGVDVGVGQDYLTDVRYRNTVSGNFAVRVFANRRLGGTDDFVGIKTPGK